MIKRLKNYAYISSIQDLIIAELPRARSGAPWVRKFGKPSIPENLVMT